MIYRLPNLTGRDYQEELRRKKIKKKKQRRCTCSSYGACLACTPIYK